MLPTINLKLTDYGKFNINPNTGRNALVGDAYWFDWQSIMDAAVAKKENIDLFLTERLARFFSKKEIKSSVLFYYAPAQDRFVITVCSLRGVNLFDALHSTSGMPGYLSYGQDYVPDNATPFFLYTDAKCFRLYPVDGPAEGAVYVSDFGNMFGLMIEETNRGNYEDMEANPEEFYDYAVVPTNPTTEIKSGDQNLVIHHVII